MDVCETLLIPTLFLQAPSLFPFLLYLNKLISDSNSKLVLLHSIPSLATNPASARSVLSVLKVLGNDPKMLPLAMQLVGKAWLQEDQLYDHMMEFLTRPLPPSLPSEGVRPVELARAVVMKDICTLR